MTIMFVCHISRCLLFLIFTRHRRSVGYCASVGPFMIGYFDFF